MDSVGDFLRSIYVRDCGLSKIRIGSKSDGGYVVYKELCEMSKIVYSAGVGDNVDFEQEWSKKWPKCKFKMFDPNIDKLPGNGNTQFTLSKYGLGQKFKPLKNVVPNSTLKMDIEWDEWGAIQIFEEEELRKMCQVIIEFHIIHVEERQDLSPYFSMVYSDVMQRINQDLFTFYHSVISRLLNWYYIFHIHANNSLPMVNVDAYTFPPLLEVSFIRKDLAKKHVASKELFPVVGLDYPNKPNRPDILDFYPFFGDSNAVE